MRTRQCFSPGLLRLFHEISHFHDEGQKNCLAAEIVLIVDVLNCLESNSCVEVCWVEFEWRKVPVRSEQDRPVFFRLLSQCQRWIGLYVAQIFA